MTSDPLDDLLDRSAPVRVDMAPADLHAMILESKAEARPPRRARRAVLLSGALAALLLGGTGVAAASSDWLWNPGLNNPDRVYYYTAPTWGQCELRFSALDTHDAVKDAEVNRVVDEWFASTDIEAAAAPLVPGYLTTMENSHGDDLSDPRRADLDAWMAHEQAVGELIHEELAAHGFDNTVLAGTDTHAQLHCDGEDWGEGQ